MKEDLEESFTVIVAGSLGYFLLRTFQAILDQLPRDFPNYANNDICENVIIVVAVISVK